MLFTPVLSCFLHPVLYPYLSLSITLAIWSAIFLSCVSPQSTITLITIISMSCVLLNIWYSSQNMHTIRLLLKDVFQKKLHQHWLMLLPISFLALSSACVLPCGSLDHTHNKLSWNDTRKSPWKARPFDFIIANKFKHSTIFYWILRVLALEKFDGCWLMNCYKNK